jgi:hypothetical protein
MATNSNIVAVAGMCLGEVLDRVTVHSLNDPERMGELLLDALQRRGMTLSHAKFLSLDVTQPLPILLQPQAE